MRVAVFTETFLPKLDGIVRVVCLLLDHLTMRGIQTMVVAPKLWSNEGYHQTEVVRIPGIQMPLYPELTVGPPNWNTYRRVKAFQPDLVHIFHPVMVGIPGMMMAKQLNVPTLASFHLDLANMADHFHLGFTKPFVNRMTRNVFNWADYALAPSKLIQRQMLDLGIRDVGLWRRGVDGEKFNPRHKHAEMRYHLSDGHPEDVLLLYVGRLSNEKQVDQIRAALQHVPNTRLAIVGDGPARASLEDHFAGTPTKFIGYLSGEPLSQAYASADMFVFPSALETFGLVVVEAMAAGLPVVSSRVGGIPDVVEIGRTGYLFDVGDTAGLVDGVRRIATDRDTMAQMGRNARAYAATQTWESMMDEVIVHYERLIQAHRAKQTAKGWLQSRGVQ